MGKYLEVPAYKLMGQKVRDVVSVAAWTRPASPEHFREEILRAVAQGYNIFKMHTCEYYDVMEQTRAAEEVAPEGFKIHYDFNSNRTLAAILPIVRELEKSRVVGYIEDPIVRSDIDGWRRLREKTRIPIIMHVPQLGGIQEIIHGLADAYMVGEGGIGNTLVRGFAYGAANIQTIIQLTGGTLTKALALHMAAVLPTATGHSINLDDQYEEDITKERIPVIEGYSPVPEGPGLGIEVDEEALARVAANKPTIIPKHVGILHLSGGHKIYTPSIPSVSQLTGREEGTIRGLKLELWEDDGSPEFTSTYERVQKEGKFIE
jgi:L-alanine-DL-glutamate epimerase-like enolase superfamily enzyme